MSSVYVRTQIKNFITANLATENTIDLTGEYREIDKVLDSHSLTYESDWLGLQFIGNEKIPITIGANNTTGKYREIGSIFLHVVAMAKSTAVNSILTRGQTIDDTFTGRRINDIVIESVSPINFEKGATLDFESGFTSASLIINYQRDLDL